jgi:hypothetical protein
MTAGTVCENAFFDVLELTMPGLLPDVDPQGLLEYSVVYTDRALNHMSQSFQGVMKDISAILKEVYHAKSAVVVPGSGTFGMEAVARQFATGKNVLVIRNGWFSYRWTQILEVGRISQESTVLKARPLGLGRQMAYAPAPIAEVVATIRAQRPAVVFAPHVETAAGMLLPDHYLRAVADAVHEVLWGDLGRHAGDRRGRAHQCPTKRLECIAMLRPGDAERARQNGDRRDHEQQLCHRSAQVAADHGSV